MNGSVSQSKRGAATLLVLAVLSFLFLFLFTGSSTRKSLLGDGPSSNEFLARFSSFDEKLSNIMKLLSNPNQPIRTTSITHKTRLTTSKYCHSKYKLLVLVTSHISNADRRQLIRRTWGNKDIQQSYNASVYFVLGHSRRRDATNAIDREEVQHKDLVQGKVLEDFHRLSFKVQLGFEWSILYCQYEVLLKVDDDVFVNIPRTIEFYEDPATPKENLYAGVIHYGGPVLRAGRYGVSMDEYPDEKYPNYCSGGGFLISRDSVEKMLPHFDIHEPLIIDDAYVGVLALKAGIKVFDRGHYFRMWQDDCSFDAKAVAQHPAKKVECMEFLFKSSMEVFTTGAIAA